MKDALMLFGIVAFIVLLMVLIIGIAMVIMTVTLIAVIVYGQISPLLAMLSLLTGMVLLAVWLLIWIGGAIKAWSE